MKPTSNATPALASACLCALALVVGSAHASPIIISNPSFESPVNPDATGAFASGESRDFGPNGAGTGVEAGDENHITGWTTVTTENAQIDGAQLAVGFKNITVAVGTQCLSLFSGASTKQFTSIPWSSLSAGAVITMTVAVGDRTVAATGLNWADQSFFAIIDGDTSGTLAAGTLLSSTVANSGELATPFTGGGGIDGGTMEDRTLSYTVLASDLLRSGNVGVLLAGYGSTAAGDGLGGSTNQAFFDNVRLDLNPDEVPPFIVSLNPGGTASGYPGAKLVATFNENIVTGSGDILLKNLTDDTQSIIAVTDSSQVTISGTMLTIDPTADLVVGKSYAVRIPTGAIKDIAAVPNAFGGINDDTTWSFTAVPFVINNFANGSDAATGISTSTTYTHLVDILKDADTAVINGVTFDNTLANYTLGGTTNNYAANNPNNGADLDSGMRVLLDHFRYGGTSATLTVADLTPRETYKLRLYVSNWADPNVTFSFDDTAPATVVSGVSRGAGQTLPSSFDYTYTLGAGDTDLAVTITPVSVGTFHWYGFSNEVVGGGGGGTFADWVTDPEFGLDPGDRDLNADPDGDGNGNGVENLFGTNPGTFSQGIVAGTYDHSVGTFTFTHPQGTLASDLTAVYQWSKDLTTFYPAGPGDGTTATFSTSTAAGVTTVTATVTGTPTNKLFVRVKVTN